MLETNFLEYSFFLHSPITTLTILIKKILSEFKTTTSTKKLFIINGVKMIFQDINYLSYPR